MKLYTHKDLNCGFVILCPDHAVKLLQSTANSLKSRYVGVPFICVTDDTANAQDMKEMKQICPTFKGKGTFSSLINIGMKHAPADWNFLVCAGATVRAGLDRKFAFFVESEKDILFPIAENKAYFVDGTLNGIFVHKKTFKEIGNWDEDGDLAMVKTLWALSAIDIGCKFKAIANSKIC